MTSRLLPRPFFVVACGSLALLLSCGQSSGQSAQNSLAPKAFSEKVQQLPDEVILDVRTPEEFAGGHLAGAQNIDWNAPQFGEAVAGLDKKKPVLVYCLSGGRSAEAAQALRKEGFKNVYELKGGLMGWRQAGLPEVKTTAEAAPVAGSPAGVSRGQYDSLVKADKAVLVDFYAEWCGPCKKMKPDLDALTQELRGKVRIERIDVDQNETLSNDLGITGLPTLMYYKDGKLIWKEMGYMSKEKIKDKLK